MPRESPRRHGLTVMALVAASLAWTGSSAPPAAGRQASAPRAPGSRVLVMPFTAQVDPGAPGGTGAALWLGEAAAILVAESLGAAGFYACSRDDRVAVFDRLRIPLSSSLSRATLVRVADLVGASEVVFGSIRLGSTLAVRVETVRLQDGRALPSVADEAGLADLFALFARVGDGVERAIGPPPASAPAPRPAISFAAFENYVKGLVAATPPAAQRFLESAMTMAPHDGRVLTAIWRVYADQGAHEKALAAASAVPADAPESRRARFSAALSLIELRRYDGAAKALAALQADRRSAAVSNALGIVALRRGGSGQGEAPSGHFARAVAEEPANTDYHFNLGYARAVAHDVAGALTAFREGVRRDAADADAHLVMSTLLQASGKTAEAARELELARLLGVSVEPAPTAPPAAVPAGLERIGADLDQAAVQALDAHEASGELRRAVYRAPYQDAPHLALGRHYHRSGRVADAIDEFKVALWCRETAEVRVALGAAFLDSGDREAARREAQRAVALAPNSNDARALLLRIGGGSLEPAVLPSPRSR
jgi:tetratricopeptide (TPR) repeat protein